jgi:hypothetical protein
MRGAALADLDADGDLNFVGSGGDRFIRGFNDGAGNFMAVTDFGRFNNLYDVLRGDLDGDMDLAIGVRYGSMTAAAFLRPARYRFP